MNKNSVLNSPKFQEYKKQKRQVLRKKILIWFFVVVVFIVGLVFASRIKKINIDISQIIISGNKIVELNDIHKVVETELSGRYFFLFQKSNSFIYPEKKIRNELLTKFKRLSTVSIYTTDTRIIHIDVTERGGEYLWCGMTYPNIENQKCFFLDNQGYIFDEAPSFSDGVYFKFYGGENNTGLGNYFLKDIFPNVIFFKDMIEKMDLKIISFSQSVDGDMNIYLTSGAKIIFKKDADFEKLAENLQALLSTEPFHTDFIKKYDSLLYIDLRFGNKVYYKFNE